MILSTAIAALVVLLLAPEASAPDGWQVIEDARMAVRRGLLEEAEQALLALEPKSDFALDGHRDLLLGNVEFERGRFAAATAHYRSSARSFERAGDEVSAAVARANLDLGGERLQLQQEHQRSLRLLRILVLGCLGLAAVGINVVARRSSMSTA